MSATFDLKHPTLLIDYSFSFGASAIYNTGLEENNIISIYWNKDHQKQCKCFCSYILQVMKQTSFNINEPYVLAITHGPGKFSCIRSVFSFAIGLALGSSPKHIVLLNSLWGLIPHDIVGNILVIGAASKYKFYCSLLDKHNVTHTRNDLPFLFLSVPRLMEYISMHIQTITKICIDISAWKQIEPTFMNIPFLFNYLYKIVVQTHPNIITLLSNIYPSNTYSSVNDIINIGCLYPHTTEL